MINAREIRAILTNEHAQEAFDNEAAEQVAAHCDAHAGKLITKANAPKGWYLVREYGWTRLFTERALRERRGSSHEHSGPCVDLILAHTETNAKYPTADELRKESPRYFAAALARNEARRALLDDPAALRRTAKLLSDAERALLAVREGMPHDFPDRYALISAAGLEGVKVGRLHL